VSARAAERGTGLDAAQHAFGLIQLAHHQPVQTIDLGFDDGDLGRGRGDQLTSQLAWSSSPIVA
jgi:hypothetical protein